MIQTSFRGTHTTMWNSDPPPWFCARNVLLYDNQLAFFLPGTRSISGVDEMRWRTVDELFGMGTALADT